MPTRGLMKGESGRSVYLWARTQEELVKIYDFCPSRVDKNDVGLVMRSSKKFVDTGSFPTSWRKFHKLRNEKDLFEIKGAQLRLLGGFLGDSFYIVACEIKQQDDLMPETVDRARANFKACKEELGNGI